MFFGCKCFSTQIIINVVGARVFSREVLFCWCLCFSLLFFSFSVCFLTLMCICSFACVFFLTLMCILRVCVFQL